MKTLFTLLLASSCAIASDRPVREIASRAERVANVPLPAFQKGYIFTLDNAAVQLFGLQGDPAFVCILQVPNGNNPKAQGSRSIPTDLPRFPLPRRLPLDSPAELFFWIRTAFRQDSSTRVSMKHRT